MQKKTTLFLQIVWSLFIVLCVLSPELHANSLHFIAYGDTRRSIEETELPQTKHNAIAGVIRERSPDFILFTGDMVYYHEFDKFLDVVTRNFFGKRTIPFYPAIGNHELMFGEKVEELARELKRKIKEWKQSSSQTPPEDLITLWTTFMQTIKTIPPEKLKKRSFSVLHKEFITSFNSTQISYLTRLLPETETEQSWYSFIKEVNDLPIQFIALNSSLPEDNEQFRWFQNELSRFHGPKIIFEHYPVYSIGHHGCMNLLKDEPAAVRFRERYATIFNDPSHNIVLVISGHEHNYQRFYRKEVRGKLLLPVYIVSGGGGAKLSGRGHCDISRIPLDGFQCFDLIPAYHFVDIEISADDKDNLILECRALGLQYDISKGLPDDNTFKNHFMKKRLRSIDHFTLKWGKNST